MTAFKKILVPTDFSPASEEAVRTAVSLAKASGGEVVVAHVTRPTVAAARNSRAAADEDTSESFDPWDRFRSLKPVDPAVRVTHEVVVSGRVSAAGVLGVLKRFGCDLIVIGSRGHGRLWRLLRWGLTDEVVRGAVCPVLVVKAQDVPSVGTRTPAMALTGVMV
jgi:nucleotide-binding universal stress UspA family protein